ncbi:MAG TPA: TolC family protein [Vicinamibacterales bacterium]|nr:TolC family protein [Vicinamibacterales bacterium]
MRSVPLHLCAVVFVFLSSLVRVAAQEEKPASHPLPPRVGVDAAPASITLEEAIRTALEQNHDVEIARLGVEESQQGVVGAEGAFDLHLMPTFEYERATTPTTSAIGGAATGSLAQRDVSGGLGLAGRTPWLGSQFTVDLSGSRTVTNNSFARVNPQFPTAFAFTYTQPLLRNATIDAERRQILLARRAVDLNDAQLAQVTMEQLSLIEVAFWELTFAVGNVSVQNDALQQARAQVSSNERQVQAGTLAVIDVVEAQTQVATLEQSLASAQESLTEAENRLKNLMLADRESPMWDQPLVPSMTMDRDVPTMAVADAVRIALANRPELASLTAQTAQNEVDQRYFRNQMRPQIDLTGSYALAGLAGTLKPAVSSPLQNASDAALLARLNDLSQRAGLEPLPAASATGTTLPDFLQGGPGSSLTNLIENRFPTALVQLQVDLPLRNRIAESNQARSVIQGRELQLRRRQLEQSVEADVRNALQRVRSAKQRLRSAGSAQRNAREQYDSERRRFESGLSTVFLVLQRQTALVTAQGQELRARADLNEAVALFDRAIGTTLTEHGVTLQR